MHVSQTCSTISFIVIFMIITLLIVICDVRSLQDNIGNDVMDAEGKKYKKLTEFTHPNDTQ